MSLKTDFFDGLTGLHAKCNDAFNAGVSLISTNLTFISNALKDKASYGETKFVISIVTSYNPGILRSNKGENLITKAYLAGVQKGLSDEDIYNYECRPTLNMSDNINTKIDLNFTFQVT